MSLRRKFLLLLGLLSVTVLVNTAVALWAVRVLERELTWPLASIEQVLRGFVTIKRELQTQHDLLQREPGDEVVRVTLRQSAEQIIGELDRLESSDSYLTRSGISTSRTLRTRVESALQEVDRWLAGDNPDAARLAVERIDASMRLIETIEARIVDDAALAVKYGRGLRSRVMFVLVISLLVLILAAWLGMKLMTRWVVRPVGGLRKAAGRIAAGDFEYRIDIPVASDGTHADELILLSTEVNHMASMVSELQEERAERERLAAIGDMTRRIAHNLRNPLAGIRSLAELTRDEAPADSDIHQLQDRIVKAVDRFEGWLAGLLSVTTPQAFDPVESAVTPWINGIIEAHRPMAQARDVTLELEADRAPEHARFDPRQLEHAVVAVLTNALEVTPRGGRVMVGVEEQGAQWFIRVADEGPGVPPEIREKIFRAYFTTKRDGSGIGLAVAREVVRLHGGQLSIETDPRRPFGGAGGGIGSIFVFELAKDGGSAVANISQQVASSGQNTHHRG